MQKLEEVLKSNFGFDSFREGQKEIIESVINGENTLVFMPTGGGKSLVYQLPGIILDGLAIIISPLISLMKDQVDVLIQRGINAKLINSTISNEEISVILSEINDVKTNPIKFLYIAPERLHSPKFLEAIKSIKISLVAIDEAHCISQWGHDFRPSYMKIKGFLEMLKNTPPSIPPLPGEGSNERKSNVDLNYKESPEYIKALLVKLRKNQTQSEEILWEILRGKKLNGIKFRRQHPFGRYIADFYSSELKLVIELDGEIHNGKKQKEYDYIRDEIILLYGVKILRINNNQILDNIDNILKNIIQFVPSPERGGLGRGEIVEVGGSCSFPIIALTATATKKVREDIVDKLGIEEYNSFVKGFDRKNIIILVREISAKQDKLDKVLEVINNTNGSGIIYCSSRKSVKEVYDFLLKKNINTGIYTGELSAEVRENMQNKFMGDEYKVIVATNAFGMGIDKNDIRFVIHYNLPGSIENYYQEVGRAGRDDKQSFGIVLASYGDTKIQEFFIENIYPKHSEVLKFYDYLFKDFSLGEGKNTNIAKTYATMAKESSVGNDMKVGSIVKILEKYGIINRGMDVYEDVDSFRGRGITLIQEKRIHSNLLIDWNRQEKLEEEAYYKLDQIKKLLFYPSCRKRFILEYFGDEEDLKNLGDSCGVCDYCLEKKKIDSGELENLVSLSVFGIVLDIIKKYDFKFGVKFIVNFLRGSKDKKIFDWNLDKDDDYGVLSEYSAELIEALIEALIKEEFLERSAGKYPLLGLTNLGKVALKNEKILKESEQDLQSYLHMKVRTNAFRKSPSKNIEKDNDGDNKQTGNYDLTLKLFKQGLNLKEIGEKMNLKSMTIENHILKLYERDDLLLNDLLKLVEFDNIVKVKNVIKEFFVGNTEKLKPIKEKLEELNLDKISYFDIKIAISMMNKKDL